MIQKILAIFKREDHAKIYVLILLLCIAALFEMFGVGMIMPFIAIIQSPDIIQKNKWFALAYEVLHAGSYNSFVILLSVLILVFYMVKNIAESWIIYWQSKFLARAESELATRLLDSYLSMPYVSYLQRNTAQLVNNVTMECSMLFAGLLKPFFIVISDTLVVAAILGLLLYISPAATLAAIATIGFCSAVFYIIMRSRLRNLGKLRQHHREQMVQWVNQSLGSIKEVIVRQRKDFFVGRFWRHSFEMIG